MGVGACAFCRNPLLWCANRNQGASGKPSVADGVGLGLGLAFGMGFASMPKAMRLEVEAWLLTFNRCYVSGAWLPLTRIGPDDGQCLTITELL